MSHCLSSISLLIRTEQILCAAYPLVKVVEIRYTLSNDLTTHERYAQHSRSGQHCCFPSDKNDAGIASLPIGAMPALPNEAVSCAH